MHMTFVVEVSLSRLSIQLQESQKVQTHTLDRTGKEAPRSPALDTKDDAVDV